MKKKENKLDQFKDKNPFSVPEGYLENLTSQIMSQLPEQPEQIEEAKQVTMMARIRPWLYMAAVFLGLLLFFRALVGITDTDEGGTTDSLLVHTTVTDSFYPEGESYDEEEEYWDYIENTYASYILAEEMQFSE
ncbi:hypothetical protein M2480_002834 [Parabacteroides sp. PFB2-12]|uniref:hypothetical protein n=1 Tax=unclassified Parabacteroides TaxID=2649774 RepID=UPI002475DDC2|nr:MULTISPECIES: hypothetical protein [unclassified Parabacteroides]MDH6344075.1 hypothetical protein [Parabacteroides sp. PM6-13]MDH6391832.1 hypothetical protein [Parabacteroides sp. PFB2-12]